MPKPSNTFFVEVTDTFGLESNYAWVQRFKVHATTERGAMRKVAREMGYGPIRKDWDTGDTARWNWKTAAICAFVTGYTDQAEHYTRIVTI